MSGEGSPSPVEMYMCGAAMLGLTCISAHVSVTLWRKRAARAAQRNRWRALSEGWFVTALVGAYSLARGAWYSFKLDYGVGESGASQVLAAVNRAALTLQLLSLILLCRQWARALAIGRGKRVFRKIDRYSIASSAGVLISGVFFSSPIASSSGKHMVGYVAISLSSLVLALIMLLLGRRVARAIGKNEAARDWQHAAIRRIRALMVVCCVTFALRSALFLYEPLTNDFYLPNPWSRIAYPYGYYLIPDLVPGLLISYIMATSLTRQRFPGGHAYLNHTSIDASRRWPGEGAADSDGGEDNDLDGAYEPPPEEHPESAGRSATEDALQPRRHTRPAPVGGGAGVAPKTSARIHSLKMLPPRGAPFGVSSKRIAASKDDELQLPTDMDVVGSLGRRRTLTDEEALEDALEEDHAVPLMHHAQPI